MHRPKPLFRTPDQAAYCYLELGNLAPENPVLGCWTPNDGFTVTLAHNTAGGKAEARYRARKKGRKPDGYPLLRFGETFTWRCKDVSKGFAEQCSRRSGRWVFRCRSKPSGLRCINRKRHGFWLGRFVGYRLF